MQYGRSVGGTIMKKIEYFNHESRDVQEYGLGLHLMQELNVGVERAGGI
jgi:hypothetical protein